MPVAGGRRSEVSRSDIIQRSEIGDRKSERGNIGRRGEGSIRQKLFGWRAKSLLPSMRSIFCCALVIVFAAVPKAEAGRVRHKPPTPFSVALEPFKLTRSVVHAAAAPIVHNAPRILAATAAAPIKLAYYAPRRLKPRPPRGSEEIYEADADEDSVKPIRVAYRPSNR